MTTTPQFDGLPGLDGAITSVSVTDTDGNPNMVIDDENNFWVTVKWSVYPPPAAAALDGTWEVDLYAESVGPGPELRIAAETQPATGVKDYQHTITMLAATHYNGLASNDTPPPDSGIYRLAVSLTYKNQAGQRLEIAGFFEGPTIMLREP